MRNLGEEAANLFVVGGEGSGKSALIRWDLSWLTGETLSIFCKSDHLHILTAMILVKSWFPPNYKVQKCQRLIGGYAEFLTITVTTKKIITTVIMITIRLLLGKYAIGESRGFLLHSGLMGQVSAKYAKYIRYMPGQVYQQNLLVTHDNDHISNIILPWHIFSTPSSNDHRTIVW